MPIVALLLKHGASVNAKDRWGGTPLRDAIREGRPEVAILLRSHGGEQMHCKTSRAATKTVCKRLEDKREEKSKDKKS